MQRIYISLCAASSSLFYMLCQVQTSLLSFIYYYTFFSSLFASIKYKSRKEREREKINISHTRRDRIARAQWLYGISGEKLRANLPAGKKETERERVCGVQLLLCGFRRKMCHWLYKWCALIAATDARYRERVRSSDC